jgi:hypothetical protein
MLSVTVWSFAAASSVHQSRLSNGRQTVETNSEKAAKVTGDAELHLHDLWDKGDEWIVSRQLAGQVLLISGFIIS